jgi:hypothetical protein
MRKFTHESSGRITLRMPPSIHAEAVELANRLGLDLNGFLNLVIRRALRHYRLEALLLGVEFERDKELVTNWMHANPGRPTREYWDDYWRLHQARDRDFRETAEFEFDNQQGSVLASAMAKYSTTKGEQHDKPKTPRTR